MAFALEMVLENSGIGGEIEDRSLVKIVGKGNVGLEEMIEFYTSLSPKKPLVHLLSHTDMYGGIHVLDMVVVTRGKVASHRNFPHNESKKKLQRYLATHPLRTRMVTPSMTLVCWVRRRWDRRLMRFLS